MPNRVVEIFLGCKAIDCFYLKCLCARSDDRSFWRLFL